MADFVEMERRPSFSSCPIRFGSIPALVLSPARFPWVPEPGGGEENGADEGHWTGRPCASAATPIRPRLRIWLGRTHTEDTA